MPNDNTHTPLPCPFCGADALAGQSRERGFFVQCVLQDCEASVDHFNGPDNAAEAWNTRTPADPKAGDWEKEVEIHTAVEIHDRFQDDGIGDTEYVRLDEARALSSAAPRITDVTSLQRYRLGLRVVDGIAEAPILEEDPNGSLVAFNHVLGLVAPATLSGITETDLDRVFEDVVSQYPLSSDRNVANEMHQQLVALLRQQPPFTPTQTEE